MLNKVSNFSFDEQQAKAVATAFDLRELTNFIWRQWKFVLAVIVGTMVVGAIYLAREVPRYTATTLVLLEPRKEKAAGQDAIFSEQQLDYTGIENQIAVLRSAVLLRRVVEKERLVQDPEFGGGGGGGFSVLGWLASQLGSSAPRTTAPQLPQDHAIPPDVMASINALQGATSVRRVGLGFVLEISVTSVDPAKAARLTNAVAEAFVVDKLDARFDAAKRASAWLSDRLEDLRRQLRDSEKAVADFRTQKGLMTGATNTTLSQEQLGQLNQRLVQARTEAAEKKARLDMLRGIEARGGSAQSLPDAMNSGLVSTLRGQEADVSRREADLVARYGDRHPLVVNVRSERRDIQRAIGAEISRISANVRNEYELARARETAVERALQDATGQTGVDNQTAITLRELERTAAVNKSLFEDFLQRAKLTEEQSTFEAREARIIQPAQTPGGPSSPRKGLVMGISMMLGLLLGVGGAVAMELLNAGFTTQRQIEEMLELPVLASVSRMAAKDTLVDGQPTLIPLLPQRKPLSRYSEAIRALRSGVQMADVDNPPKVVMLTSTLPSEGKTTMALSLASSASSAGLRVLFMDCDLRHPSSSKFVGREKEEGLVELLAGQVEAKQVIRKYEDGNFWVLPAGGKTQNPPDLLSSERMKAFLQSFRGTFDYIVIDSPPIGPVIDAVVMAPLVDKVIYVVRWAGTAREMVQASVQRFGPRKVAGVAFNHVNDAQAQKYGRYAYNYYYGGRYYKNYYSE